MLRAVRRPRRLADVLLQVGQALRLAAVGRHARRAGARLLSSSPRLETNASCVPSGDQRGCESFFPVVNRRGGSEPSVRASQIDWRYSFSSRSIDQTTYATSSPPGRSRGSETPVSCVDVLGPHPRHDAQLSHGRFSDGGDRPSPAQKQVEWDLSDLYEGPDDPAHRVRARRGARRRAGVPRALPRQARRALCRRAERRGRRARADQVGLDARRDVRAAAAGGRQLRPGARRARPEGARAEHADRDRAPLLRPRVGGSSTTTSPSGCSPTRRSSTTPPSSARSAATGRTS